MKSSDLTLFRSVADDIDASLYDQLQHPDKNLIEQVESGEYFANKTISYDFEDKEAKLEVTLRYYQRLALYFTQCYLEQSYLKGSNTNNKLSYWMATGSGKTIIMQANIMDYFEHIRANNPEEIEVIITSPLKELIGQLQREMREFFQQPFFNDFTWKLKVETTQGLIESYKKQSHEIVGDKHYRLLLVDEAHIGLGGKDKGAFTTVRNELTKNRQQSFMFEYSATFYDVSDKNKDEYANRIIYEYDYGKFYTDQYGKDFKFGVVKDDAIAEDENKDIQRNLEENLSEFHKKMEAFDDYNKAHPSKPFPDRPLLVMAGNTVSASDTNKEGKEESSNVAKIISYFAALPKLGQLQQKIFNAQRGKLHIFKSVETGELLLSYGENIEPFGLITVGDVSKFLANANIKSLIESDDVISKTQKFTPVNHQFKTIDFDTSPINILIGSRKFSAGWNSFRVSQICLIHFGTGKGSTIVQMFGRGVRLKGLNDDGKRQEMDYVESDTGKVEFLPWAKNYSLDNHAFDHLKYLETLFIYSLRNTYLRAFIEEDTNIYKPTLTIIKSTTKIKGLGRPIFRINKSAMQKNSLVNCSITIDEKKGSPRWLISTLVGGEHYLDLPLILNLGVQEQNLLNYKSIVWLENFIDQAFLERLIEHKLERAYLVAEGVDLSFILEALNNENICVNYDADIISPVQFQKLLIKVVDHVISKVKNKVRYDKNKSQYHFDVPIRNDDCISEYQLKVSLAKDSDAQKVKLELDKEDSYKTFFHMLKHYYQPLAINPHAEIKGTVHQAINDLGFKSVTQNTKSVFSAYETYFNSVENIKVSPDKLDAYEAKFLHDLQVYIDANHLNLTVLRNLPNGNIGIPSDDGVFYPDFILWYKKGEQEHIIFCDPKGIRNAEVEWKVCQAPYAIKDIEKQWVNSNIYLHSFIVSHTSFKEVKWKPINSLQTYDQCDVFYNLVFMDEENYIERIFNGLTTDMSWHYQFQKYVEHMDEKVIDEWCNDKKRTSHIKRIEEIEEQESLGKEQALVLYFRVWGCEDKIKQELEQNLKDDIRDTVVEEILPNVLSDLLPGIRTAETVYRLAGRIWQRMKEDS